MFLNATKVGTYTLQVAFKQFNLFVVTVKVIPNVLYHVTLVSYLPTLDLNKQKQVIVMNGTDKYINTVNMQHYKNVIQISNTTSKDITQLSGP